MRTGIELGEFNDISGESAAGLRLGRRGRRATRFQASILRLHSLEKKLESLIIRLNCLENKIHFLLFCQQSKKNMMTLAATQY